MSPKLLKLQIVTSLCTFAIAVLDLPLHLCSNPQRCSVSQVKIGGDQAVSPSSDVYMSQF
jgi:hypothetical protein